MKKVRVGVFETNSSSTHVISLGKSTSLLDTIIPNKDGVIYLEPGAYGWEWDKLTTAIDKARYCLTACLYKESNKEEALNTLKQVIKRQTLCKEVRFKLLNVPVDEQSEYYIDHQSLDNNILDLVLESDKLSNLIFNKESIIFLGNDNDDPPIDFYKDSSPIKYSYRLVLPSYPDIKCKEFYYYPSKLDIRWAIEALNIRFRLVNEELIVENKEDNSLEDIDYYYFLPYCRDFLEEDNEEEYKNYYYDEDTQTFIYSSIVKDKLRFHNPNDLSSFIEIAYSLESIDD